MLSSIFPSIFFTKKETLNFLANVPSTASINNAIPKNKKTDFRLLLNMHIIAKKPAIKPEHVIKWTVQARKISKFFLFFSINFFNLFIKISTINSCRGSNSCKLIL